MKVADLEVLLLDRKLGGGVEVRLPNENRWLLVTKENGFRVDTTESKPGDHKQCPDHHDRPCDQTRHRPTPSVIRTHADRRGSLGAIGFFLVMPLGLFLQYFGFIGWVLCIISLFRASESNTSRGFAIAGIVLGAIGGISRLFTVFSVML